MLIAVSYLQIQKKYRKKQDRNDFFNFFKITIKKENNLA
jgi:hypothetical protein